ncbi:transposase [bacterium]|nr:transposase [bacterium]
MADLCLSLFPWTVFRKTKEAIKPHTLLDLRGNVPTYIWITEGKTHDINILDERIPETGSFYILDSVFIDFKRCFRLNQENAYFIARAKSNLKYT